MEMTFDPGNIQFKDSPLSSKTGCIISAFSPLWRTAAKPQHFMQQGVNVWLSWWTRDSFRLQLGAYMAIYAGLGLFSGICTYIRSIGIATLGIKGSTSLHAQLYDSVLASRMEWFDHCDSQ